MTRRDLERELARKTGETLDTIRHRGFELVEMPNDEPHIVDWDQLDAQRTAILPSRYRECAA